ELPEMGVVSDRKRMADYDCFGFTHDSKGCLDDVKGTCQRCESEQKNVAIVDSAQECWFTVVDGSHQYSALYDNKHGYGDIGNVKTRSEDAEQQISIRLADGPRQHH